MAGQNVQDGFPLAHRSPFNYIDKHKSHFATLLQMQELTEF
jgi:hypothetical protein